MSDQAKTITYGDYLRLLGLAVLAKQAQATVISLGWAIQDIVHEARGNFTVPNGPAYEGGHIGDFVNSPDPNVDELLRKLGIQVQPDALQPAGGRQP